MTTDEFYDGIKSIIDLYHDNPGTWISQNAEKIKTLGRGSGRLFHAALRACVGGGGTLAFFFEDFARWRKAGLDAIAAEEKKESAGKVEYANRNGNAGSIAKTVEAPLDDDERLVAAAFLRDLRQNLVKGERP